MSAPTPFRAPDSEPNELQTPLRYEALTERELSLILRALSPLQAAVLGIDLADLSAGVGILDEASKCIWLGDGRRVTLSMKREAFFGSVTKVADPLSKPVNRNT